MSVSEQAPASAAGRLRKARRAGRLKNRSRTCTVVPSGQPAGSSESTRPASSAMRVPASWPRARVVISTRLTAAIEGRASPRKPIVDTSTRSLTSRSLLVAWFSNAMRTCSGGMPQPSSVMRR